MRNPRSQPSRTAVSTHWSVTIPITKMYSMPRLRSTYSKLVELNRLDEVLGMTISFASGFSSSMTSASHESLAANRPEIL